MISGRLEKEDIDKMRIISVPKIDRKKSENEAKDGKARRRSFEAFVEHSNWFWPLTKRQYS